MTAVRRRGWCRLVVACVASGALGVHAQGVVRLDQSEAPAIRIPWAQPHHAGHEDAACAALVTVRSIDVVHCDGDQLEFRVKPGQTVRLSELSAKLREGIPEAFFTLGQLQVHDAFELWLPEGHDASQVEALQRALEGRNTVASVERVGPRQLKIHVREGRQFVLGQLLQLYVRALRHRGRILMDDIVGDLVFYPAEG